MNFYEIKLKKKGGKDMMNLVTTFDVFHGDKFLCNFVSHKPSNTKIARTQIFNSLVLVHSNNGIIEEKKKKRETERNYGLRKGKEWN
jgi:bisphosphoglycerate-dependent phosphoglycerate mutase